MKSFTKKDLILFKKLNTPAKIQDFLNTIPINFEKSGETLKSPLKVLRTNSAHCFEGALLGAYILSLYEYPPLVLHLESDWNDVDHVIVPFKEDGLWGALSKTNHAVLRYREPVYKTIRELVMSYFHEYFVNNGEKTLRRYSAPLNLNIFEASWSIEEGNLWGIDEELDKVKHFDIMPKKILKKFRKADKIEREAGKIVEWKRSKKS